MKFAHMADCHIGGWAEPKMRQLNIESFVRAVDISINEKVDFVLISGDLFNTSLPAMDPLKVTVRKLSDLKKAGIPVYIIAGSHDFSPTGKTMIDVLGEAGLCKNVVKGAVVDGKLKLNFTVDNKTGAKITGMLGRRGMLEKSFYEELDTASLEAEEGYKIFMFHTAITELKPKGMERMDSAPMSLLPKGFDYYAGGHVHIISDVNLEGYKQVVYPGPIYPNNFKELEELTNGGFYIVGDESARYIPIEIRKTHSIVIDCKDKDAERVKQELNSAVADGDLSKMIVMIRLKGTLSSGKQSDLDFRTLFQNIYDKGAYFVMKNTSGLQSTDFEEVKIKPGSAEDIESDLIKEHLGQIKLDGMTDEEGMTKNLIKILDTDKNEGEKVHDFEDRVISELDRMLHFGK